MSEKTPEEIADEILAKVQGKPKHRARGKQNGDANPNWRNACIKNETQKPLPILANALIGLRAQWPQHFNYDEMLCAPILAQPLEDGPAFATRPVTAR